MFTGIVEELGEIVAIEGLADAARLTIRGKLVTSDAGHGDSIAVNGVCLTVVDVADGAFTADVMQETLNRSSMRRPRGLAGQPGTGRGAEQPTRRTSRPGPRRRHRVVLSRSPSQNWEVVRIALPDAAVPLRGGEGLHHRRRHLADGLRARCHGHPRRRRSADWFEISLIPTTLSLTNLGSAAVGAPVNLEVDVIAKYVERLQQRG